MLRWLRLLMLFPSAVTAEMAAYRFDFDRRDLELPLQVRQADLSCFIAESFALLRRNRMFLVSCFADQHLQLQ
jgi:hypothetical protein